MIESLRARLNGRGGVLLAVALTLGAATATIAEIPALRMILATPTILFVPGYLLVSLLLRRGSLTVLELAVVSTGASIAMTILVGLLVSTTVGLSSVSWSLALTLLVLALAAPLLLRGQPHIPGRRPLGIGFGLKRREILLGILAVVGAVAVVMGARSIAALQDDPPPAQLWLVPGAGNQPVQLGVRAATPGGSYTVRVTSSGEILREFDLELRDGEVWVAELVFETAERRAPVVARLIDGTTGAELRFVVLQPVSNGEQ